MEKGMRYHRAVMGIAGTQDKASIIAEWEKGLLSLQEAQLGGNESARANTERMHKLKMAVRKFAENFQQHSPSLVT